MPFENLDKVKIKKLNLGLLILFTAIALALNIFFPFPGLIGFAFLSIPATLLMLADRVRDGVICAVVGCLLLLLVNYLLVPVAILLIISVAFVFKAAIQKEKSLKWILGSNFMIFWGAVILYILLVSIASRVNFFSQSLSNYNSYIDQLGSDPSISSYYSSLLAEGAQFDAILQQTLDILRFIPYIVPGTLVVFFALAALLNYWGCYTFFRRYGIELKTLVLFRKWDLPWYYVWGIIAGLVSILIPWGGSTFGRVLDIIGYNLIIIFGVLYFVLGISVLWGIFERFKVSFFWRIAFLLFMGFFLVFMVFLLPLLGLVDIWANLRKLKRV
jgi:uncharacterized protein YybS (DUF2232 family)